MKVIRVCLIFFFILSFSYKILLACGASCLNCHGIDFENPKEHKIIKECISCHKRGCGKEEDVDFFSRSSGSNACGQDCFECHSVLPRDSHHLKISKCVKCHKTMNVNHE